MLTLWDIRDYWCSCFLSRRCFLGKFIYST